MFKSRSERIKWENELFEVDEIRDHTVNDSQIFMLVIWKGSGEEDNSWEPHQGLKKTAPDLVRAYWV